MYAVFSPFVGTVDYVFSGRISVIYLAFQLLHSPISLDCDSWCAETTRKYPIKLFDSETRFGMATSWREDPRLTTALREFGTVSTDYSSQKSKQQVTGRTLSFIALCH